MLKRIRNYIKIIYNLTCLLVRSRTRITNWAFNTLDHDLTLPKLHTYGFHNRFSKLQAFFDYNTILNYFVAI